MALGFDQYKVLAAAERLESFTVRDLSAAAVVREDYVHKILQRHPVYFERTQRLSRGHGRPADVYQVPDRARQKLREQLDETRSEMRRSIGAAVVETAHEPAVVPPASLVAAEDELLNEFTEAESDAERQACVERARSLLAVDELSTRHVAELAARKNLADRLLEFREFEVKLRHERDFPSVRVADIVLRFTQALLRAAGRLPEWRREQIERCLLSSFVARRLSELTWPTTSDLLREAESGMAACRAFAPHEYEPGYGAATAIGGFEEYGEGEQQQIAY